MTESYWIETLGCPKNQVDSDKLVGTLTADGLVPARDASSADVVVVNTCAFIDEARQESVNTILALDSARRESSRLIVTGCMAERYGAELEEAMPEVDQVAPFGVPVVLGPTRSANGETVVPSFDLLELPRPPASAPWAYVKVAEGCDRNCGFCAIPSFRGKQRSRTMTSILDEVDQLGVAEVVLVAQDLAAYGRDQGQGSRQIVPLVAEVAQRVSWVRLLYLYPSDLTDELVDTICGTGVPYFDLSLQHVSPPLMRRMRRWGNGDVFRDRISTIRERESGATFRSNFIVGYPGETEADHDALLRFVEEVELDWCGFFAYSEEEGTYGADLDGKVAPNLIGERLAELGELQDRITTRKRLDLIGDQRLVLVDGPTSGRSVSEAPEIDGVVQLKQPPAGTGPSPEVGSFVQAQIVDAEGPDLVASVVEVADAPVGAKQ